MLRSRNRHAAELVISALHKNKQKKKVAGRCGIFGTYIAFIQELPAEDQNNFLPSYE